MKTPLSGNFAAVVVDDELFCRGGLVVALSAVVRIIITPAVASWQRKKV